MNIIKKIIIFCLLGGLIPCSSNGLSSQQIKDELFLFSKDVLKYTCVSLLVYYTSKKIIAKIGELKQQSPETINPTVNTELESNSSKIKVLFSDIIGATQAKEELQNIVNLLNAVNKQTKLPHGILLVGKPGNGKTLLAKALSHEAKCSFYYMTGSEFTETLVGMGAARMRKLFAQARKNAPSIVFIDEIDAIGQMRNPGSNIEYWNTLNQLLVEMDGFNTDLSNVIVIGATNKPNVLDPALLRSGRFDRIIEVSNPSAQEREEILEFYLNKCTYDFSINLEKIIQMTENCSAADLTNLVNRASLIASRQDLPVIIEQDLLQAYYEAMVTEKAEDYKKSETKFIDVAGVVEAKEELIDVIDFLKNPEKFARLGAKVPRGVLLFGDPGNGKTLLAKAVAGEANCHFINVNGSEFIEKYVGVGASRVRELFDTARKYGTCIIFIDEIDAIGSNRSWNRDSSENNQTLNQLLVEMDGFDSDACTIIVIGATNRKEVLDPALMRRFTKQVEVPFPDVQSRYEILQLHAKNKKLDPSVDLFVLAQATIGFSASTLANLLNEAALLSAKRDGNTVIVPSDVEEARDKIILGKESKTKIFTLEDKKVTAYHEAGHALISLLHPDHSQQLFKITITPRGDTLGATHYTPDRERYVQTKEQALAQICSLLGGRAAEELIFKQQTTGAGSDFRHATSIARNMVCMWGMSDLGCVIYNPSDYSYQYSQKIAEIIDLEVKKIVDTCYSKTIQILRANRDKLDRLANALLEKELLSAQEVRSLLGFTN